DLAVPHLVSAVIHFDPEIAAVRTAEFPLPLVVNTLRFVGLETFLHAVEHLLRRRVLLRAHAADAKHRHRQTNQNAFCFHPILNRCCQTVWLSTLRLTTRDDDDRMRSPDSALRRSFSRQSQLQSFPHGRANPWRGFFPRDRQSVSRRKT